MNGYRWSDLERRLCLSGLWATAAHWTGSLSDQGSHKSIMPTRLFNIYLQQFSANPALRAAFQLAHPILFCITLGGHLSRSQYAAWFSLSEQRYDDSFSSYLFDLESAPDIPVRLGKHPVIPVRSGKYPYQTCSIWKVPPMPAANKRKLFLLILSVSCVISSRNPGLIRVLFFEGGSDVLVVALYLRLHGSYRQAWIW